MVNFENLKLVALGNPLLDMQVRDGQDVLQKYGLKPNDAVLASPEQLSIYEHLVENYQVTYVAGGAAQNTARCAQYALPEGSTAYLGCVGNDDLAQQLRAANEREGLQSVYQVPSPEDTPETLAARPLYNRTNKFFTAQSLADLIGSIEDESVKAKLNGELQRVKQLYDRLSATYQEGKTSGAESSSFFK